MLYYVKSKKARAININNNVKISKNLIFYIHTIWLFIILKQVLLVITVCININVFIFKFN